MQKSDSSHCRWRALFQKLSVDYIEVVMYWQLVNSAWNINTFSVKLMTHPCFWCVAVTQFCMLWQIGLYHYCHFSGNEEATAGN
jgi:hypothetical protein